MKIARRLSGFTLLELLVALTMMSLVAAGLFASVRTASKARDAAASVLAPIRQMQTALDMIGADLDNALPPTGVMAGPFIGSLYGTNARFSDDVEFYAVGPATDLNGTDSTLRGGIRKINLFMDRDTDGTTVLLRKVTGNLLSQKTVVPLQEVLCRNIRSLNLRYYDGQTWRESWDSTTLSNMLPIAVAVTLEVDGQIGADGKPQPYRIVRIFDLPCYVDTSTTTTTGGGG